jgi:hypothetical protein
MQRWTGIVFAALFGAALALVVAKGGPKPPPTKAPADAGTDGAKPTASASPSSGKPDAGEPADAGDAPNGDDPPPVAMELGTSDAGLTLPNGQVAPPLAAEAPKSVVFGAILVQYKGAQGAPTNAPPREQALERAKSLAEEAKKDFKATVSKGDKGSTENAGRMPRGMMEPAPEFLLFSLDKDGTSDPVDTPRGYLILHRIE